MRDASAESTSPQLMSASTGSLRAALLSHIYGTKTPFPHHFSIGNTDNPTLCVVSHFSIYMDTPFTLSPLVCLPHQPMTKNVVLQVPHKQSENQRQVLKWCSQVFHVRVIRMIAKCSHINLFILSYNDNIKNENKNI